MRLLFVLKFIFNPKKMQPILGPSVIAVQGFAFKSLL